MLRGRIVIAAVAALGLAAAALVVLSLVRAGGGPAGDPGQGSHRPLIKRVGTGVGSAVAQPAPEHAEFMVDVPPPVEWPMGEPAPADLFFGDQNIIVSPGQSETLAGDGRAENVDGVGSGASFGEMGGVAVIDRTAFVSTSTAIRRVDLDTAEVTTLSGSPTGSGCATGAATTSRLRGPAGDLVTDGVTLFAATGCGIVTVDPSTGTTAILVPWAGSLTVGPDGWVYVGRDRGHTIVRVDPSTGEAATYVTYEPGSQVFGLTADSTYLWAAVAPGPRGRIAMDRIEFETGEIVRHFSPFEQDVVGIGQLSSAGNYLYAPSVSGSGVLQYTKRQAAWGTAVGVEHGDSDGVWNAAAFGSVRAVAIDGINAILIVDAENHKLRRASFSSIAGAGMGYP